MLEVLQQARIVLVETVAKTMLEEQLPCKFAKVLDANKTMLVVQKQARTVRVEAVDRTMLEEQLLYRVAKVLNANRIMLLVLLLIRIVIKVIVNRTLLVPAMEIWVVFSVELLVFSVNHVSPSVVNVKNGYIFL